MALTQVERERITDSRQKVQSVTHSLKQVDPNKIPHFEAIEDCLAEAEKSLSRALQSSPPSAVPGTSSPPRKN
jgi:hypothetical protein